MSAIALVVTDVDGTLVVPHASVVSSPVHDALRAVQQAGVSVAAATARPHEMAQELFVKLGLRGPSIFDGGASIRDVTSGELLWQNWLDVSRLQVIARIVAPYADMVDFFPGFQLMPIKDFTVGAITEPAPYAWCLVQRDALAQIMKQLQEVQGLNIHPMLGWPDRPDMIDIQITDRNADKFHAVNALRSLLAVSKEQTLAIGDGGNDIPLLKAAGVKVAMGNAVAELKELADYTVSSVAADGWSEAMRRFVLRPDLV